MALPDSTSTAAPPASDASADAARRPPSIQIWNIALSVALTAGVLAGICYFTFDLDTFGRMARETHWGLLAAAVVVTLARVAVGGWRLSFVSQGRLGLMDGTRGQLAWEFFSSVTPSAVGGGPVASFYVARDCNVTVGEATALMMFSVLLDQLWFLVAIPCILAASLAIDVIPAAVGTAGLWASMAAFLGVLVWAGLFAFTMLFRPRLLEHLADTVLQWNYLRRFRSRVLPEMRSFTKQARRLGQQPLSFYVKGFGLTALTWLGRYALVYVIIRSVYASVDPLLAVVRTAAMMLLGLVMPTPGGSGGLEGLYALFLGPLMPDALVAPTLLTWRVLGYYLFIALGAYLFMHQIRQAWAGDATPSESSSDGSPLASESREPVLTDETP